MGRIYCTSRASSSHGGVTASRQQQAWLVTEAHSDADAETGAETDSDLEADASAHTEANEGMDADADADADDSSLIRKLANSWSIYSAWCPSHAVTSTHRASG
jgi:hypothetical protein